MALPLRAAEALGLVLVVLESSLIVPALGAAVVLGLDGCVAVAGAVDLGGRPPAVDVVRELPDGATVPDALPAAAAVAAVRVGLLAGGLLWAGDLLVFFSGCVFAGALPARGAEAVLVDALVAATAGAFLVFPPLSLAAVDWTSGVLRRSVLRVGAGAFFGAVTDGFVFLVVCPRCSVVASFRFGVG